MIEEAVSGSGVVTEEDKASDAVRIDQENLELPQQKITSVLSAEYKAYEYQVLDKTPEDKKARIRVVFTKDNAEAYLFELDYLKEWSVEKTGAALSESIYNRIGVIGMPVILVDAPVDVYEAIQADFTERFDSEIKKAQFKSVSGYIGSVNKAPFVFRKAETNEIDDLVKERGIYDLSEAKKQMPDYGTVNRVSVDFGGTAIKVRGVINGQECAYAQAWGCEPREISNPKLYIDLVGRAINGALAQVGADKSCLEVIGISWASPVANGKIAGGSPIVQGLKPEDFDWLKANFNEQISKEFNNAFTWVSNDGNSGLMGAYIALAEIQGRTIGFGLGTALAFGLS